MCTQVNDYELIKLVESFPILYDKDLARGHKNAEQKDKAWAELSKALSASERACITRWKSIRDRFGKEYRRVQEHPEVPSYWDMFPHLEFLKNHYKHGNAVKNEVDIKYEPKERKRKSRGRNYDTSQLDDESQHEEDVNPEELIVNQQLITLVRQHPVLYDKQKIRDSKNLTAKSEAWNEISENINISEEICYKRWKKLRDRFAREYRNHQLNPENPVTWCYFSDLSFLEGHYRKGIPLPVEEMKARKLKKAQAAAAAAAAANNTAPAENPWGSDFPYEEIDDEQPIPEHEEYNDLQTLDELLIIPAKKEPMFTSPQQRFHTDNNIGSTSRLRNETIAEPEDKLTSVITNMQTVLRQSQDCLKSLQDQNQRHKEELEFTAAAVSPPPSGVLQKVAILLDGLASEERLKAERKILQFLCECQIKALNNEEIEDVGGVQIYG